MSLDCVLIAAGGTGGHIYPALAIAEALHRLRPDCKIYFVGTAHGLENTIIPKAGYPVLHIPVGRLNRNVSRVERLTTVFKLPFAFLKSIWLILCFRPQFVLGVGGHASGPLLLMASLLGKKTAIWEPNAMPGMANRILSRFVDECFVVFEEGQKHLRGKKFFKCGMPVRGEIEKVGAKEPARRRQATGGGASAAEERFHIFSFGGSQGSRSLNLAVAEMMKGGGDWVRSVELLQQTGPTEFQRLQEAYGARLAELPVELKDYIHDMEARYKWADLVIARSGTGTLSELAASGKPAILIPLATAADNHQQKNAEAFVDLGAAVMILQKDLSGDVLREAVRKLQADPQGLDRMGEKARSFHEPAAADRIVRHILERF